MADKAEDEPKGESAPLSAADKRAIARFTHWVRRQPGHPRAHERFEAVSGEGKVKTIHYGQTIPREDI